MAEMKSQQGNLVLQGTWQCVDVPMQRRGADRSDPSDRLTADRLHFDGSPAATTTPYSTQQYDVHADIQEITVIGYNRVD